MPCRLSFMKWFLVFVIAGLLTGPVTAQVPAVPESVQEAPPPAREFRGSWMTTVYNLDWPSRPGLPPAAQRKELREMLESAAGLGLNAVLFQVRPGGDAVYASALEPWSSVLTGKMGVDPGYDPLALAVEEAHRLGLELHAWFNPFRAKAGKGEAAENHWTLRHPEWVRETKSHPFMDPGIPEVREHVLAVMRDVLTRYDVDGIHIDDYFYPYPEFGPGAVRLEVPLGDETRHAAEGNGLSLADWRRRNINLFVEALYQMTRRIKPHVRVGISPFGIWQPGIPEGIEARVNAYDHLYGDSRKWLQEKWCDYLTPQLYWPISQEKQSFRTLMEWWTAQSTGRPVWPGMAVDRVASAKDSSLPLSEITDQLAVMRQHALTPGCVLWRLSFLTRDVRGIGALVRNEGFPGKAIPPAAPWLGDGVPAAPVLRAVPESAGLRLSWEPSPDAGTAARWWVVQSRQRGAWRQHAALFHDRNSFELGAGVEAVAVRAVSGSGVAGPAAVWTDPVR